MHLNDTPKSNVVQFKSAKDREEERKQADALARILAYAARLPPLKPTPEA